VISTGHVLTTTGRRTVKVMMDKLNGTVEVGVDCLSVAA
jgi:hypothetical protein